jgi:hypothetical protein
MLRTSFILRPSFLMVLLIAISPLTAALASSDDVPSPCTDVLPLSLEESTHGYAAATASAFYALEVTRPAMVVVEAHALGGGDLAASPQIRLRGRACELRSASGVSSVVSPLPLIRGRHVERLEVPGTYFLEVVAEDLMDRRFRLEAWIVGRQIAESRPAAGPLKDGEGSGDIPPPPMDEWDELRTSPPLGVLGDTQGAFRFHEWCPLARRPELLATFTCSRRLRLDAAGSVSVRPLLSGRLEPVGVDLVEPAWLVTAVASVDVFDADGHRVTTLTAKAATRLEAGGYFLRRIGVGMIHLDIELD